MVNMRSERRGVWRPLLLLSFACVLSSTSAADGEASYLVREFLQSATAVCADGSPGSYYMATNATSSDYVFFFGGDGGGGSTPSCAHDEALCEEEGRELGSGGDRGEDMRAASVLAAGEGENSLFSTYNRVYVPHCSSDMFLLDTESADGDLQFRGRHILEETLRVVLSNLTTGVNVVLGGSAAGGVGAFNAARWLLDSFDQVAELSVIIDSAFLFDFPGYLTPFLEYLQGDTSAAYSSHCSEEFDGGPCCLQFACMVQRGYYPLVESESETAMSTSEYGGRMRGTFALSSLQHPLEVQEAIAQLAASEGGLAPTLALDAGGDDFRLTDPSLRNLAALYPSELSVFSMGCADDTLLVVEGINSSTCTSGLQAAISPGYATDQEVACSCLFGEDGEAERRTCEGAWDDEEVGLRWSVSQSDEQWRTLQVQETSVLLAMEQWWLGRGDPSEQVLIVDDCDGLGCNPTCPSELLVPGPRSESEGAVAWAVVLVTLACAAFVLGGGFFGAAWSFLQWRRVERIVAKIRSSSSPSSGFSTSGNNTSSSSSINTSGKGRADDVGGGKGAVASDCRPVLEWEAVSHWAPLETGTPSQGSGSSAEKQMLFAVDGAVPEGALCALMGPSDSDKTTLLDLLGGRCAVGRAEGSVVSDGKPLFTAGQQASATGCRVGYVRDGHGGIVTGLSVFDNLMFAAMLRTPGSLEEQARRVETVIEDTGLERSRDSMGSDLTAVQERLLSLALELLSDCRILLLDQPFKGLGSSESLQLMTTLQELSKKNKVASLISVAQPGPEIWKLFSHSILLKSGRTVYCGPADQALRGVARYLPIPETTDAHQQHLQQHPHQQQGGKGARLRVLSGEDTEVASSSDMASTVTMNMMADSVGSGPMTRAGRLYGGYESRSEDGGVDADGRSSRSGGNTHRRNHSISSSTGGGGGGGGDGGGYCYGYNLHSASAPSSMWHAGSSVSGATAASEFAYDIEAGGAETSSSAGGGGGGGSDRGAPRGTPASSRARERASEGRRRSSQASAADGNGGTEVGVGGGSLRGGWKTTDRASRGTATPSRNSFRSRRPQYHQHNSHHPGLSVAGSTASTASGVDYHAAIRAGARNILDGYSAADAVEASAGDAAVSQRHRRLRRGGMSDSVSFSFSESSTGSVGGACVVGSEVSVRSPAVTMHRSDPGLIMDLLAVIDGHALDEIRAAGRSSGPEDAGNLARLGLSSKLEGKHPSPTKANGILGTPATMMAGGNLEAAVRRARAEGVSTAAAAPSVGVAAAAADDAASSGAAVVDAATSGVAIADGAASGVAAVITGDGVVAPLSTVSVVGETAGGAAEGGGKGGGKGTTGKGVPQEKKTAKQESTEDDGGDGGKAAAAAAAGGTTLTAGKSARAVSWKVAAILTARSWKSGHARRLLRHLLVLVGATFIVAASLRAAGGNDASVALSHLGFSVLLAILLPALIVYRPLMMPKTRREWMSIAEAEAADDLYHPLCITAGIVLEHLAVGVFASFLVVGIMHAVLWHPVVSELPAFGGGVYLQLSCTVTLMAWVMIPLFNTLAVSRLSRSNARTLGVSLSSVWAFFSGVFLLTSALPDVLRLLTYTSPHYWATSFMLRVLLDGLDMADDCDYGSPIYCATSFGDLVATRLGLHDWSAGTYAVVITVFAIASIGLFVAAQHVLHHFRGEGYLVLAPATVQEQARPAHPGKAPSPPARIVRGAGPHDGSCAAAIIESVNSAAGSAAVSANDYGGCAGGDAMGGTTIGGGNGSSVCGSGVGGDVYGSGVGGVGLGGGGDAVGVEGNVGPVERNSAPIDFGRGSGALTGRRISHVRSSSAIFSRGSKGKKAFAILAQQEEQQRAASLMTTAAIIEAELQKQRLASADGVPAGAYNRTSSGSSFFGHKLKWPTFATPGRSRQRAVHTEFPDSSRGSSRSHSLKSSPPPISESAFPEDGPSPSPLTPGKASTKITAETLARGAETSRSPHNFARGLGGWWAETSDGGFEGRSSLRLAGTGGDAGGDAGGGNDEDAAGLVLEAGGGGDDGGRKEAGPTDSAAASVAGDTPAAPAAPAEEASASAERAPEPQPVEAGARRDPVAVIAAAVASQRPLSSKFGLSRMESTSTQASSSSAAKHPPSLMTRYRPLRGAAKTGALAAGTAARATQAQAGASAEGAATAAAAAAAATPAAAGAEASPQQSIRLPAAVALAGMGSRGRVFATSRSGSSSSPGVSAKPQPSPQAVSAKCRASSPTATAVDGSLGGAGNGADNPAAPGLSSQGGVGGSPPQTQQQQQQQQQVENPALSSGNTGVASSPSLQQPQQQQLRQQNQCAQTPPRPPLRLVPAALERMPSIAAASPEQERGHAEEMKQEEQGEGEGKEETGSTKIKEELRLDADAVGQRSSPPTAAVAAAAAAAAAVTGDREGAEEDAPLFHRGFQVLRPGFEPLLSVPEQHQFTPREPTHLGPNPGKLTPGRPLSEMVAAAAQTPTRGGYGGFAQPHKPKRSMATTPSGPAAKRSSGVFFPGSSSSSSPSSHGGGSGTGSTSGDSDSGGAGNSQSSESSTFSTPMSCRAAGTIGVAEDQGGGSGGGDGGGGGDKPNEPPAAAARAAEFAMAGEAVSVSFSPGYGME